MEKSHQNPAKARGRALITLGLGAALVLGLAACDPMPKPPEGVTREAGIGNGEITQALESDFGKPNPGEVTMVVFSADWCGPCRAMKPTWASFSSETTGRARVVKIDVDENPELAQKYSISALPTILVWKNNDVTALVGGQSLPTLLSYVN